MPTREVCDRCGVPASVTWLDEADRILTFCGHHSRELADALERAGYVMVDDSLVPA